ncbi:uncharacterized protein LOC110464325 [Mizuhopecten yessoensis]|uniref:uncharacterized protein LOC110464325 n=1 Tax=Mizuhopecten yessoensis TaxID=6573 RepID=UPI000B45CD16|nr:uncharacterized protein LOC110464325 [Mizuhopecten yessoensis]
MRTESVASREESKKCELHGENVIKFCVDHKQLCCVKCEQDNHKDCKNVKSIKDYCQTLGEMPEVDGEKTLLTDLKQLINDMQKQKCYLEKDQQIALEKIFEVSKSMNMFLAALSEELFETKEGEQDQIEMKLQLCEQLWASIKDSLDSPQTSVAGADNLGKIVRYQSRCTQITFAEDVVTQIKKSQRSVRVRYVTDTSPASLPQCLGRIEAQKDLI